MRAINISWPEVIFVQAPTCYTHQVQISALRWDKSFVSHWNIKLDEQVLNTKRAELFLQWVVGANLFVEQIS